MLLWGVSSPSPYPEEAGQGDNGGHRISVQDSPKPHCLSPTQPSHSPVCCSKISVLSPMYRSCRGNETYATESPAGLNTKHSTSSPCPRKVLRSHSQSTNNNGCQHTEATWRRQRVCRILVPATHAVLLLTMAPVGPNSGLILRTRDMAK